jgi:uncharacterized membrane protein
MPYIVAIVLALLGAGIGEGEGFLTGLVLGIAFILWRQRADLAALDARVDKLTKQLAGLTTAPAPLPEAPVSTPTVEQAEPAPRAVEPSAPPAVAAPPDSQPAPAQPTPEVWATPPYEPSAFELAIERGIASVKRFFTTGNVVVRIGAVVLFFGIAFLLRYAYENELLPVELRLGGAALGGIVLVAAGWRLRHRADTYGLVLQGAGIGVLYLTIFAAARLYELLPLSAAFAMLLALVVASSVLAVVQHSQALAIFAMSGGFLAPVLTSTGQGSHVALFSYYALLNAGIFAMAWFRTWRWLNWTGFVFTFVIGALWGNNYYRPELFASTEPFLLLFFFYYVGVSVLFARKRGVDLRGVVDGTLVFGVPIVAFALQAALVADMPFGLAFSALGAAAVYTLLALWLRSQGAFAMLLTPSFVALGVAFATLAIPFAFDDQRFTAASWALEGAGLVWVGLRQRQWLPRVAGLLLQTAGGVAYLFEIGSDVGPHLVLNSAYLGALMLALAGAFSSYQLTKSDVPKRTEKMLRWAYLAWAFVWWFGGASREIGHFEPWWLGTFVNNDVNEHLFDAFAALSVGLFVWLAHRLAWREILTPGFLLLPWLVFAALWFALDGYHVAPLADLGWLGWPLGIAALVLHLYAAESYGRITHLWHAGAWWFTTILVTWILRDAVESLAIADVWSSVLWGVIPLAVIAWLHRHRDAERWPIVVHRASYTTWGIAPVAVYLLLWLLAIGATPGDPRPLPYLPIANPIDLVSIAILLVVFVWARDIAGPVAGTPIHVVLGGIAFLWLNLAAARAVHFWGNVSYPLDIIVGSDAFQTTATILWTLTALVLMGIGTRLGRRASWIAGAALLGLVIVKLFTLDLGNLDVIARIVSFISVGILMLLIGYFAPLPPRPASEREAAA